MNIYSKQLTETVNRYIELSEQVQNALAALEGFYNEPDTQIVLNNVEQAEISEETLKHYEDSCMCSSYESYMSNMVIG